MIREKKTTLRICASCEWIFNSSPTDDDPKGVECPKCKFGSYTAHYVYGRNAYRYVKSQLPWKNKKMFEYESKLNVEIKETP